MKREEPQVITPVAGLVFIALSAIVLFALYRKREVRAGLKIPFVTFFFEANDRGDDPHPIRNKSKEDKDA